jgi:two-component system nitrogen regulation response regulator GlnG
LSAEVEKYLSQLEWAGNIRQLRSVCIWLTVMTPGKVVSVHDLPLELNQAHQATQAPVVSTDWETPLRLYARQFLQQGKINLHDEAEQVFEKVLIEEALAFTRFHRQETAVLLGWGRNTLTRKSQALGIDE